eukprot:2089592-Pleurochrysis_carterae.AAC.1
MAAERLQLLLAEAESVAASRAASFLTPAYERYRRQAARYRDWCVFVFHPPVMRLHVLLGQSWSPSVAHVVSKDMRRFCKASCRGTD